MCHSCVVRSLCAALTIVLCACGPNRAYRTHLVAAGDVTCTVLEADDARMSKNCEHVTPEVGNDGTYELHFIEFDDQGWLYSNKHPSEDKLVRDPSQQIDHLMGRLTQLLDEQIDLSVIVFVHGWKHGAQLDDPNVQEFRKLLKSVGLQEGDQARRKGLHARKVVGVYVAWRGKPWVLPDLLLSLSFWARKEAARRVSVGSARELFARLRAIRRGYNKAPPCKTATGAASEQAEKRPRVRTLMIGHSFGGLILYAAMSGPLIEALAAQQDLQEFKNGEDCVDRPADMVVLVNPAFEASRYEALYRVAIRYKPKQFQPPLLVSVTSKKDWATGIAFPMGRSVNTFFEHPISSSDEEVAMKKTPGHIERYLTHRLYARAPDDEGSSRDPVVPGRGVYCPSTWTSVDDLEKLRHDRGAEAFQKAIKENRRLEDSHSADFFKQYLIPGHLLRPKWVRTFCGGGHLAPIDDNGIDNSNAVIWNVVTDAGVIKSHDDIMNPVFQGFVRQLYADVSSHPR